MTYAQSQVWPIKTRIDLISGDNMNRFLNDNWDEILKELKPAVQETFGLAFAEISNRIFTKVPYADIFPQ